MFTPGTPTKDTAIFIEKAVFERDGIQKTEKEPPKKIDHIGIAVSSLEEALPFYVNQLHLKLEAIEEVATEGVKVAFIKIGDSRIELLEPMSEDSPIASFIQKRGEGIHHIALADDRIDERLRELSANGVRLINNTPVKGAGGANIAFLHPKSAGGVLYELCEKDTKEEE